ncbi:MAG: hypothetical protein RSB66_04700, partial [Clostridium sp.]
LTVNGVDAIITGIEDTLVGDQNIVLVLSAAVDASGTTSLTTLEEGVGNTQIEIKDPKGNKAKPVTIQITGKELTPEAVAGNLAQSAIDAIPNITSPVVAGFTLPLTSNGQNIIWSSNDQAIVISSLTGEATVVRPDGADQPVVLTASITVNGQTKTKDFTVVVTKKE